MKGDNSDVEELIKFLQQLEERLRIFIEEDSEYFIKRYPKKIFGKSINQWKQAWENTQLHFKSARDYLVIIKSTESLENVGLTGSELQIKLMVLEEAYDELMELESRFFKKSKSEKKSTGQRFRRLKDHREKYFDHADTILSSLGNVGIPGIDAISEFKTVIEKVLKWWGRA